MGSDGLSPFVILLINVTNLRYALMCSFIESVAKIRVSSNQ